LGEGSPCPACRVGVLVVVTVFLLEVAVEILLSLGLKLNFTTQLYKRWCDNLAQVKTEKNDITEELRPS
jgi:hypothetical protein